MRYMLTLAAVHDDDHDAADIEAATDAMWGEVHLADETPVEFVTVGAAVLDHAGVQDIIGALNVSAMSGIIEIDELIDSVRDTLSNALKVAQA